MLAGGNASRQHLNHIQTGEVAEKQRGFWTGVITVHGEKNN